MTLPKIEKLGVQHRSMVFSREAVDAEARTVPIAISSEEPVDRWFGREVLDHSSMAAIRMDRAGSANGLPLLWGHDAGSMDSLLGRVTDFELGSDRVLRGVAKFGTSEAAEQALNLIKEGTLTDISVGYRIHELTTENPGKPSETQRATDWEPLEVSFVSVPADASVGVGRDASTETPAAIHRDEHAEGLNPAPVARTMEVPIMETTPVAAQQAANTNILADRQEALAIMDIAHRLGIGPQVVEALTTNPSIDAARAKAMEMIREKLAQPLPAPAPVVELSNSEAKRYSIGRAISAHCDKRGAFELEVSAEIAKRLGKETNGFFVPTLTRANPPMDTLTAAYGQKLVFTEQGEFIDLLRAKLTLLGLGAKFLGGLKGNVGFPRQTAANGLTWLGENPASGVTATALQVDLVTLSPKQGVSQTSVTRTLLAQGTPDADAMINDDLAVIHAVGIEMAAINGAGTPAPTGVLGTSGIGSVAGGTNGLQPTYGNIVDLETAVAVANADIATMAYLTTPGIRGRLKQTQQFSGTNGASVWDYLQAAYPKSAATNNMPSTLTKGSSSGICHAILFGNFSDLIIGEWGAFEVIPDPYTQAGKGLVVLTTNQLIDVAVRRPASFAAMKDALV